MPAWKSLMMAGISLKLCVQAAAASVCVRKVYSVNVDKAATKWVSWHKAGHSLVCSLAGCWQRLLLALGCLGHGINALVAPAVTPGTHLSTVPDPACSD